MPAANMLFPRDVLSDVSGVRNTYTSWDSCMSKSYCKWPVIVAIIVGSLIVLSILWCAIRCLCCGFECCCGCFKCCNACCPGPRSRNDRQQPPPQAPQYAQYQPPPMQFYPTQSAPQTATFAGPTKEYKYNADALPAMPSWSTATSHQVEDKDHPEGTDAERLDAGSSPNQALLSAGQGVDNPYGAHDSLHHGTRNDTPNMQYAAPPAQSYSPSPYAGQQQPPQRFTPSPYANHAPQQRHNPSPYGAPPQSQTWDARVQAPSPSPYTSSYANAQPLMHPQPAPYMGQTNPNSWR